MGGGQKNRLPVIKPSHGNVHSTVIIINNNIVRLKVTKKVDFKISHHKKRNCNYA